MTATPLSPTMVKALNGLKDGKAHSALDLWCSLATLRALQRRGLVQWLTVVRQEAWRISEAGKEVVQALEAKP